MANGRIAPVRTDGGALVAGDSRPDSTVRIVGPDGDPDMTVAVVGDQVVDLSGATPGDVLIVQDDGTLALASPAAARTALELGTAALEPSSAFDPSGAADDALTAALAAADYAVHDEIHSTTLTSQLFWPTVIPSNGIANAIVRRELEWTWIPAQDMDVEYGLSCGLSAAVAAQITHLSLIDLQAVAAGQSLANAQILDVLTPSNSGASGAVVYDVANTAPRFCRANVLQSVAAYAWYSGTAPAINSLLVNAPGIAANAKHCRLTIKRIG